MSRACKISQKAIIELLITSAAHKRVKVLLGGESGAGFIPLKLHTERLSLC